MEEELIMEKELMKSAKVISAVFTPFFIPLVAFLILFAFSYLSIMPIGYKLFVLGVVFSFTILLPIAAILLYRKINGYSAAELSERKRRFVPFLLTITAYIGCLMLMHKLNIPWYMNGIILTALLMMVFCVLLNLRWKLSEHMAGAGATIGGLVAFSALFAYNPVWWLCVLILVSGALGTARMVLCHHTLGEVLGGFAVGLVCALSVLHPIGNVLFRIFLF